MKKCNLFDSLTIIDIEEKEYSCEMHTQNHFEIIYIHYGKGHHIYNNISTEYEKGDLFLLAPGDRHYFKVDQLTRFTYIKFTHSYFESNKHLTNDDFHIVSPIEIMQMQWLKEEKITVNEPCQTVLKNTFDNITFYNYSKDIIHSPIVFYQILSIFGMIKEYLNSRNFVLTTHIPSNGHIATYIHEHIYNKENTSIQAIANHFNISPLYFSSYFKQNFKMNYRDYLNQHIIKLVKKRLDNGGYKLKEIADEFCFTDTSHLSKFFRKHEGISPSEYKNQTKKNIITNELL